MGEIAFPGIVMLLKLATKLFVGKSATPFDFVKAMVAFPIDITFLALSFGAALLYTIPPSEIKVGSIKLIIVFIFVAILLAILTTAFCQKSDKALDQLRARQTIGYSILTYGMSLGALLGSLHVEGFVR